ncbi:dimethylamine monooxygenase subunit DmmA family protein [Aeromicrobium sp.]|uniref:dimethylamine monooxygenase subunit DmmA family protein n=1 Tax=Aeromicrobium sp. TaxID=1871063 RepID=UPI002FC972B2
MTAGLDLTAASYLVIAIGTDPVTASVTQAWTAEAEGVAPTTLVVLDSMDSQADRDVLATVLGQTCVGVRCLIAGGRYDVMQALAFARERGALPPELASRVTHERDLPVYCAHCRGTHRVAAVPGGEVACPGCHRRLEVHEHHSAVLGSYLASDAQARELVP